MSSRLPPQKLSIKHEHTLRCSNFLIFCFYNSSASCWFDIFSLLIADVPCVAEVSDHVYVTAPLEDFLSKNLWTIESIPHWSL